MEDMNIRIGLLFLVLLALLALTGCDPYKVSPDMYKAPLVLQNRLLPLKVEIDTASYVRGILFRKAGIMALEPHNPKPSTEFDHNMINTVLSDLKQLGNEYVSNAMSSAEPKTYGRLVFSVTGTEQNLIYNRIPGLNPANTNMLGRFICKTMPIFAEQYQPSHWEYNDSVMVTLYDNNNEVRVTINGVVRSDNETLGISDPYFNFVTRPDVQRYRWFGTNLFFMNLVLSDFYNNQPAPIDTINSELYKADDIVYHIFKQLPDSLREK